MYSNVRVSDSSVTNEDYAKRAVEFGHGIISTSEHGWQGRYIEGYELAKKYGLKFVFGAEAYWVIDRKEPDRTNCHIFIAAKNENGRRCINDSLSEAALTGFYGQPRLDIELILSLPAEDVIVTTACVAYWKYENIVEITKQFHDHFKNNFYLEVQYHQTDLQRDLNRKILGLSEEMGIQLIMGCDSHCITTDDQLIRSDFIASKGMVYSDEEGWYLDYPDGNEAYKRFADQCVLTHDQIMSAINNTNIFLTVEDYDCPCFNKDIKMPTLYPNLTQDEKDQIYKDAVWNAWEEEKKHIDPSLWDHYVFEIQREIDTVIVTKHSDYFLLDKEIIRKGKELGGVVTASGRGSGVSFITNKLLGLTDVDRIAAKVKMYPERFMSSTRILESKSLADIDMNLADPAPFAEAQRQLLGDDHSYPMITYGTMKPKAAWKMYAKSQNVEFETANEISGQISKYEFAIKHAEDEDERNEINILDYIDKEYREIYSHSIEYQGVVVSASIHPCSHLIYQGEIRKEIGIAKIKDNIVCIMDGKWAEDYKFLKNDLLTVSVIDLIQRVYDRIGIKRHSVRELLALCPPEDKVWDIYKLGITIGINQCEQEGTKQRVMKYAPINISELCAFIAAIRPGFKSMYKKFESREHFEYGIKALDELIQTEEMPHSFVLYQEMSMAVLNYAGIPMTECYEIIKNISKKRVDKVLSYKQQFITLCQDVLVTKEGLQKEEAKEKTDQIWQILEDSSRYSFNASHSYSVALDSLYGAYLKTYYPLEFYEVILKLCEQGGHKDKMMAAKEEAEKFFKIKFPPYRFRQDNRGVTLDRDKNQITNMLTAIKGFGKRIASTLYECGKVDFNSRVASSLYASEKYEFPLFFPVLQWLDQNKIKSTTVIPLIKIDYFSEFGNIPTLLEITNMFDFFDRGNSRSIKKSKECEFCDIISELGDDKGKNGNELSAWKINPLIMQVLLAECEEHIRKKELPDATFLEKMAYQIEVLGYFDLTTDKPEDKRKTMVLQVFPRKSAKDGQVWGYGILVKSIGTGVSAWLSCRAKTFESDPFDKGDVIFCSRIEKTERGYYNLLDWQKLS